MATVADGAVRRSVFKRAVRETPPINSAISLPDAVGAPGFVSAPVRAKGVRASVFNKNELTSTGLATLDSALGGGVALGTVVCLIEDSPTECYALLLKHFLAQGLVHGHASVLCSADDDLLRTLPAPIQPSDETAEGASKPKTFNSAAAIRSGFSASSRAGAEVPREEHLKIAWRYKESLSSTAERQIAMSSVPSDYCLRFDLSKSQDAAEAAVTRGADSGIAADVVKHLPLRDWEQHAPPHGVRRVWQQLAGLIDSHASDGRVFRIAVESLGAPLWWSGNGNVQAGQGTGAACSSGLRTRGLRDALYFMHTLKGKIRGNKCVAYVSVPHDLAAAPEVCFSTIACTTTQTIARPDIARPADCTTRTHACTHARDS